MATPPRQMPGHVEGAYKDAVDNTIFLKRQQWVATNYALLVYAAIFVISARYFSRTDVTRGWLGVITVLTFFFHLYMMRLFEREITKLRTRLDWIYRTYFQRRGAGGLEFADGPETILVSIGSFGGAYSSLTGRSCVDHDLSILSPTHR
jgi:hypothetical protein